MLVVVCTTCLCVCVSVCVCVCVCVMLSLPACVLEVSEMYLAVSLRKATQQVHALLHLQHEH